MPTHAEKRFLPYSAEAMFDLVADIERYPEFLPWCTGVRVFRREPNALYADLMVGFKMVRETFTSKVTLARPDRIDVEYLRGPFRRLNNHWLFVPKDGGCEIDFYIDFEFHSRILQKLMGTLFNEAVRRMVGAFETRARDMFGPGDAPAGARFATRTPPG
jgi:coenzyme Q-binding protein COQ10